MIRELSVQEQKYQAVLAVLVDGRSRHVMPPTGVMVGSSTPAQRKILGRGEGWASM